MLVLQNILRKNENKKNVNCISVKCVEELLLFNKRDDRIPFLIF